MWEISDSRSLGGGVRGVWLNFQLSAHKLYFTFQLLSEPLDSREKAGATGRAGGRREEGFGLGDGGRGRLVDGWGHALGRTGLGNFRCMFQFFSGWEGFGVGVGLWIGGCGGGLGSGDLAAIQPQQEAFASFTRTKKKKVVLDTGRLSQSTTLQSSPRKQELINVACTGGGPG